MTTLLALLVIFAQVAQSVAWPRYDVDLVLQPDGSLVVTESQTIDFRGSFHEGFRAVPLDRTTGITDVSVTDGSTGQQLDRGTSRTSQGLAIDWTFPPVTNATRRFDLRYTAHGAARIYDAGDQVWWKAIYANRPGPVQQGTITLRLPADAPSGTVRATMYTYRDDGQTTREVGPGTVVDNRTIRWDVSSLPSGTGVEVRAQFPHGLLPNAQAPPWQADVDREQYLTETVAPIGGFIVLLLTAAILVGGGAWLFILWYGRGREPAVGKVPPTLSEPPSDLAAPLVGTLVDGVADLQDAVAILVDLAQRHVVDLSYENGDVRVTLHTPTDDPALQPWERVLLTALFGVGKREGQIMLSSARGDFAAAVPVLEERLHEGVASNGLFAANPELTRRRYTRLGWILVGVGLVIGIGAFVVLGSFVGGAALPGFALLLIGSVLIKLARAMPRRTPRGELEAKRWLAFRNHLQHAPSRSDSYLPYAVAFGLDRDFLRRLEQTGAQPPEWLPRRGPGGVVFVPGGYYGGGWPGPHRGPSPSSGDGDGGFGPGPQAPNPQGWSDALADLLNAASESMAHGGGSGGWSGGGWGGGGGGGGGSGGFR
jgi:hypothetical protein